MKVSGSEWEGVKGRTKISPTHSSTHQRNALTHSVIVTHSHSVSHCQLTHSLTVNSLTHCQLTHSLSTHSLSLNHSLSTHSLSVGQIDRWSVSWSVGQIDR